MRDLYFTTSNPRHTYKSEGFFRLFFQLRKTANFGTRSILSNYKKLLVLRKFFSWFYFVPSKRFYFSLFQKQFSKQRVNFRRLAAFFNVLERNLVVLLVRSQFFKNYAVAWANIFAGTIFVNGFNVKRSFYTTQIGDVIEVFYSLIYLLPYLFFRKRLKFKTYRFRYFNQLKLIGTKMTSTVFKSTTKLYARWKIKTKFVKKNFSKSLSYWIISI